MKLFIRKTLILLSDIHAVFVLKDRSIMYEYKKQLGVRTSWRDYARNPTVGIFSKYFK
jgi:hypothetical protein